jgi:hypothetical protein
MEGWTVSIEKKVRETKSGQGKGDVLNLVILCFLVEEKSGHVDEQVRLRQSKGNAGTNKQNRVLQLKGFSQLMKYIIQKSRRQDDIAL